MTPGLTEILDQWQSGDKAALDRALPLLYEELRALAQQQLLRERAGHTLQPTGLVHEAYLKLVAQREVNFANRAQFLGVAALTMRRVLLHHAEQRRAGKREGYANAIALNEGLDSLEASAEVDLQTFHLALEKLAAMDARQGRIVEMRVFGGLSVEETAEALGVSEPTVKRDWAVARLWLRRELFG